MLRGFSFIWEHGLAREGAKVAVMGDSIVILCLVSRQWKACIHTLMNLVTEVEELVRSCLWKVQYEYVPHKQNGGADAICN